MSHYFNYASQFHWLPRLMCSQIYRTHTTCIRVVCADEFIQPFGIEKLKKKKRNYRKKISARIVQIKCGLLLLTTLLQKALHFVCRLFTVGFLLPSPPDISVVDGELLFTLIHSLEAMGNLLFIFCRAFKLNFAKQTRPTSLFAYKIFCKM